MKIALMQPYLFPYLGYFQLIQATDYFGIYDDVQFINRGWINRNRILTNSGPMKFSFSVKKDSYKEIIKNRFFHDNFELEKEKFLRVLYMHYRKAPYYIQTINLINKIFEYKNVNVSDFIKFSLRIICDELGLETIFLSSDLWEMENYGNDNQEKLVRKLNRLENFNIEQMINPIGGSNMYDKEFFKKENYKLSFLSSNDIHYRQFGKSFEKDLSIIDVLMFNSYDEVKNLLNEYKLI